MTTENHPTKTLAEGEELKTLREEYEVLWSMYVDARAQIAELKAEAERTQDALQRAKGFVQVLADNSPDDPIADNGMTVWDGLRTDAPAVIAILSRTQEPHNDQ